MKKGIVLKDCNSIKKTTNYYKNHHSAINNNNAQTRGYIEPGKNNYTDRL